MRGYEHSGSYLSEDVTFFLKIVDQHEIAVTDKEELIQSGQRHYSEFTSPEHSPSSTYIDLYYDALSRNSTRLASDILLLAKEISYSCEGMICLVSLARAGTPIGILLRRALIKYHNREVFHASISIIAGRGIDTNALDEIRSNPKILDNSIFFVDGWTGKGVISAELRNSISKYNHDRAASLSTGLYVVADLCGYAKYSATNEDYLIPSCLLGATVSGLISRSILNDQVVGPNDYHACRFYEHLGEHDKSREFIEEIYLRMGEVNSSQTHTDHSPRSYNPTNFQRARLALDQWRCKYNLPSLGLIKPGIGEATRVLLRRVPEVLIVRNTHDVQVAATMQLAKEKEVPVLVDSNLPWAALSIIKAQQT